MKYKQSGIFLISNSINDKVFIEFSSNIPKEIINTYNLLNSGIHNNRVLQIDYSLYGKENFKFQVIDNVKAENSKKLNALLKQRKEHWVKQFKAFLYSHGYNFKTTKNCWNVQDDYRDVFKKIYSLLDFNLPYAKERTQLLHTTLEGNLSNWMIEYVSSPAFWDKQVKTSNDSLIESETDSFLKRLEGLANYLLHPRYDDFVQEELIKKNPKSQRRSPKNHLTKSKMKEIKKKELHTSNFALDVEKSTKHFFEQHITERDTEKFKEIKELDDFLKKLSVQLGYGLPKNDRETIQKQIEELHGKKHLNLLKDFYKELSKEILIMKERLVGTIHFKKLQKGTTKFDYDCDTGYFDELNTYVSVSENKIDFKNEKHILELLNHYYSLKKGCADKPSSDMWHILYVLDELIEKSNFEDYVKDTLTMKIEGATGNEITAYLLEKYKLTLNDDRISKIFNSFIPKMIADTYLNDYEEWLYTYKVKGKYKKCKSCNSNKLLTEKYYRKRSDKKGDSYYNKCRICEK
ncbi:hypothetical protein EEL31_09245 [Brevibacillus laterosporus]|nr:hypothetical protein [Brevibacillus laterosporus]TPG68692.1 hypothetical protein EEL31_09245 [Brevibacillus laterosporus]